MLCVAVEYYSSQDKAVLSSSTGFRSVCVDCTFVLCGDGVLSVLKQGSAAMFHRVKGLDISI